MYILFIFFTQAYLIYNILHQVQRKFQSFILKIIFVKKISFKKKIHKSYQDPAPSFGGVKEKKCQCYDPT
jgi:hypothetical protein